jgi:hypothetical protein
MRTLSYLIVVGLVLLPGTASSAFAFSSQDSSSAEENFFGDSDKVDTTLPANVPPQYLTNFAGRPMVGKTIKLGKDSSVTLQFIGPQGGGMAESPFLRDPAMDTVPSKREW